MRPIKISLAPKTANTTCFNAQTFNSTGAAVAPTTLVTDDGLAHKVTLIAPVQATLAGVTFTITGTDADGKVLVETGLVGPASGATVTSTNYFKSIATIQPSSTMGALVVSVGTAAASLSQSLPLEWRSIVGATHVVEVTGTVNYTLQETLDNVYSAQEGALSWGSYTSAFSAKTATVSGVGLLAANAARILTNTVTNGATITWRIIQATQITG